MEDIEDYYEEGNEKNNEDFIEELGKKEKIEEVEKKYKDKSKKLRKKYEKEYKNNLEIERKKEIEKIKNKTKSKKLTQNEQYESKGLDLELTWKEKVSLSISLISYRFGRKLSDFYEKIVPNRVIYFNYKLKNNSQRIFREIIEFIQETSNIIINSLGQFFKAISRFFVLFFTKINEKIKILINKIFKKKKEEERKDSKNGKK
jgi:hypothetical protein